MFSDEFMTACSTVVDKLEGGAKIITDAGGLTKYGISQKSYPGLDIRNLTRDQALQIYWDDYWVVVKADKLPWPLSAIVFDTAVNQGAKAAGTILQQAAEIPVDGVIGVQTLTKVAKWDTLELCARVLAKRSLRYYGTKGFDKSGFGWLCRIGRLTLAL